MRPPVRPQTEQTEIGWVPRMIPLLLLLGTLLFTSRLSPVAWASPLDCQYASFLRVEAIGGGSNDKNVPLPALSSTLTIQRNIFGSLEPAPAGSPTFAPSHFRVGRDNLDNRDLTRLNSCRYSLRDHTVVMQAVIKSTGKALSKVFIPVMRQPTLSYSAKRHVPQIRAILPDIAIPPRDAASSLIGPIQENGRADQSNFLPRRRAVAAVAIGPFPDESLPLFEGRPIFAADPLKTNFLLPGSESLRMNMTTTQALHGGNCANACP